MATSLPRLVFPGESVSSLLLSAAPAGATVRLGAGLHLLPARGAAPGGAADGAEEADAEDGDVVATRVGLLAARAGGGGGGAVRVSVLSGGGGGMPATTRVALTADEAAAVRRLQDLGFSQQQALEAFLACDRNEQLAANYLFESGGE